MVVCIAEIHSSHHDQLSEFQQYKTAPVELAFLTPKSFSIFYVVLCIAYIIYIYAYIDSVSAVTTRLGSVMLTTIAIILGVHIRIMPR